MSSKPDIADPPAFLAHYARLGLTSCASGLAALLLTACTSLFGLADAGQTVAQDALPTPPSTLADNAAQCAAGASLPAASAPVFSPPAETSVQRLLAYADRARSLPSGELAQEIARLGNPSAPAEQLQLALLLGQLHQTPELIRAQELVNRVIASPAPDAQPLRPLARLLAVRYGEQRRLEEQLEKQIQQVREVQRRLDQTHEKLEALKAIERSLTNRPPVASASAPASRPRRTSP